jgi:hypothetical protein
MAIELPYLLLQTIIYGVIVYAMIGFEWTATKFFWYLFFMYITLVYYTFYGMMSVAVTPNHSIASVVSSAFYAIWNLFSGFVVPRTVSFLLNLDQIRSQTPSLNLFHSVVHCRGFQCGGDGTTISVLSLGPCMD